MVLGFHQIGFHWHRMWTHFWCRLADPKSATGVALHIVARWGCRGCVACDPSLATRAGARVSLCVTLVGRCLCVCHWRQAVLVLTCSWLGDGAGSYLRAARSALAKAESSWQHWCWVGWRSCCVYFCPVHSTLAGAVLNRLGYHASLPRCGVGAQSAGEGATVGHVAKVCMGWCTARAGGVASSGSGAGVPHVERRWWGWRSCEGLRWLFGGWQ